MDLATRPILAEMIVFTLPDLIRKLRFYERYGVEEYYLFDPDRVVLSGWRRAGEGRRAAPSVRRQLERDKRNAHRRENARNETGVPSKRNVLPQRVPNTYP